MVDRQDLEIVNGHNLVVGMNVPNLVEWGSKGGIEPLDNKLTLVVVRVGRVGPVKHGSVTDNHVVQVKSSIFQIF